MRFFELSEKKINFYIFLLAFTFAITCMFVAREIIIPNMDWNGIDGHLAGDPQLYHKAAALKAEDMKRNGLLKFELRPDSSGPAGVTSLMYLFFDSVVGVVILNALLHALSVLICYLILSNWFLPKYSLIGAMPLLFSPYFMVWFSQINKDSYAIAGALLVIYGSLELIKKATLDSNKHNYLSGVVIISSGAFLTSLVRPYINQIHFVSLLVIFLTPLIFRRVKKWKTFLLSVLLVLFVVRVQSTGATSDQTIDSFKEFIQTPALKANETIVDKCFAKVSSENWRNDFSVGYINEKIKGIVGQRCNIFRLLYTQTNPNTLFSIVDYDILPGSTSEAFAYLPRAVSLGVFAPWPNMWSYIFTKRFSIFYMIAPVEALVLYLGLCFLFYWVFKTKQFLILGPVFMSFSVMGIYGLSTPFVGVLYRYRYSWWMLLIGLGIGAILTVLQKRKIE